MIVLTRLSVARAGGILRFVQCTLPTACRNAPRNPTVTLAARRHWVRGAPLQQASCKHRRTSAASGSLRTAAPHARDRLPPLCQMPRGSDPRAARSAAPPLACRALAFQASSAGRARRTTSPVRTQSDRLPDPRNVATRHAIRIMRAPVVLVSPCHASAFASRNPFRRVASGHPRFPGRHRPSLPVRKPACAPVAATAFRIPLPVRQPRCIRRPPAPARMIRLSKLPVSSGPCPAATAPVRRPFPASSGAAALPGPSAAPPWIPPPASTPRGRRAAPASPPLPGSAAWRTICGQGAYPSRETASFRAARATRTARPAAPSGQRRRQPLRTVPVRRRPAHPPSALATLDACPRTPDAWHAFRMHRTRSAEPLRRLCYTRSGKDTTCRRPSRDGQRIAWGTPSSSLRKLRGLSLEL